MASGKINFDFDEKSCPKIKKLFCFQSNLTSLGLPFLSPMAELKILGQTISYRCIRPTKHIFSGNLRLKLAFQNCRYNWTWSWQCRENHRRTWGSQVAWCKRMKPLLGDNREGIRPIQQCCHFRSVLERLKNPILMAFHKFLIQ